MERIELPAAELEHLFYIEVTLHPEIPIGQTGGGLLTVCPISGGAFRGERLSGKVLDFGADWNLLHADTVDRIDTRYLLRTDDDAVISLFTDGRAMISKEQEEAMSRGEWVDPADYYFRQHLFFETADPRYDWLNWSCCFAVIGMRDANTVCYDAYRVK